MTNKQQETGIIIHSVCISRTAQWKMALHATTRPLGGGCSDADGGDPVVHGILLGHRAPAAAQSTTGKNSSVGCVMVVTEVVPVCRETPTKSIVDMALRLVEANHSHKHKSLLEESQPTPPPPTAIIGWYTSSTTSGDIHEQEEQTSLPNAAACRILSSISELSSSSSSSSLHDANVVDGAHDGSATMNHPPGPLFLLSLASTSKLFNYILMNKNDQSKHHPSSVCEAVYQWDCKSRKIVHVRDAILKGSDNTTVISDDTNNTTTTDLSIHRPMVVYDFVDHMTDCELVDSKWIDN